MNQDKEIDSYHLGKFKNKIKYGLNPQWGGGGFGPSLLFTYFFYF